MMKNMYKLIIFFGVFQFTVLMVNSFGIFPNTLYSDVDMAELNDAITTGGDFLTVTDAILNYLFEIPDIPLLSGTFTFAMFVTIFFGLGAAAAWATHSWTPVVIAILATTFVPMILKSYGFFSKLLYNWDISALFYLGICLSVGIILISVITIVESPAQGESG